MKSGEKRRTIAGNVEEGQRIIMMKKRWDSTEKAEKEVGILVLEKRSKRLGLSTEKATEEEVGQERP